MARTVTATAIKRIITRGLTGWQAGKLLLQDYVDCYCGRPSVLTEGDIATIKQARMEPQDVRDYNKVVALARGFEKGMMTAESASKDARLQLIPLEEACQDADKRRTVELFDSVGPRIVTRKQYDEIVAAQREKKLAFEYGLWYVIEERFYAIAPPEAKEQIDASGVDIESAEDFAAAVPEKYLDMSKQAVDQIHSLHKSGRLPAVYHDEDAKEVEPLLAKWPKDGLTAKQAMKLVDMLYVTGQQLYDCEELPEWKAFIDAYQQHWLDDDERFRHAYAVLDDCPGPWMDDAGYYKRPSQPSEWITSRTELFLGLRDWNGKAKKSVKRVGAELKATLEKAEENIRFFLAIKVVLDAAVDAVGLDVPEENGIFTRCHVPLDAHIELFNMRLEDVKEERRAGKDGQYRLEKALRMLPTIERERLTPTADSVAELRAHILDGLPADDWLQARLRTLAYGDKFSFETWLS